MLLKLEQQGVRLSGLGHYLPAQIRSNADIIQRGQLPIDEAWIRRRVGVEQRHVVAEDESTSDMAIAAARRALTDAGVDAEELDLIVLSTISPDHPNPATACAVQAALGNSHCPSFDLSAACSGFLYALDTGVRHILTGAQKVLVISAEVRSRFVNPKDPATAPIFGDAAAAVVLEPGPVGAGVLGLQLMADGRSYDSVQIPAGGARQPASADSVARAQHFIHMNNGERIFFEVVEGMSEHTAGFLERMQLSLDEIDFVIPHQANLNILNEVARRLELPADKLVTHLQQVGNTSSASIPLALSALRDSFPSGSRLLLVAVGAGATMGLAVLQL